MHRIGLLCVGLSFLILPGCTAVGVAVGAGATAGVAASQEGGLARAKNDFVIQTEINDLWFKHDLEMFSKLDLTVTQGRVLVTGVVQDPEHRVEAVRLAWQPEGVKEVINEVNVADSPGIVGFARDSWISGQLRTKITFDREVQSINYNIDTVQGVVYLMGLAQNQRELNRVVELARTIPDVKQVISYVKFVGDNNPLNNQEFSTGANDAPSNLIVTDGFETQGAPLTGVEPEAAADEVFVDPVSEPTPLRADDRIESESLLWDRNR